MRIIDREMICAYLWQDIIRLGFCPSGTRDQKRWLLEYGRSLREFWEIDKYPDKPSEKNGWIGATIDCGRLDLCLEYAINSIKKFNVRFLFSPPSKTELMWTHDVDCKYFTFPTQLFLTYRRGRNTAVREFSDDNIKTVLDGLLIHPAAHLHIESPIDDHEIRVGGVIDNPFQYLFQLRYQLCPHEAKRQAERSRLATLFSEAVRANSQISASQLMTQPQV